MNTVRTPKGLENLQTFPGGHRHLKRFDPRIKMLWRLLVNHANADFTVIYTKKQLADLLDVHPNTIANWLKFFEQRQWIERPRRYGGKGQGNEIVLVWMQRGAELAAKRERAASYQKAKQQKREQNIKKWLTTQQRQTALKQPKDLNSRGAVIGTLRQILAPRITGEAVVERCLSVAGKWLKNGYPLDLMKKVLGHLKAVKHIAVPRWATDARSIFRWFESLLLKLASMGTAWWDKLNIRLEARHFHKLAQNAEQAAETGQGCPVCANVHEDAQRCSEWAYTRRDEAMREYRLDIWLTQS